MIGGTETFVDAMETFSSDYVATLAKTKSKTFCDCGRVGGFEVCIFVRIAIGLQYISLIDDFF